jgi:hypothetical protein
MFREKIRQLPEARSQRFDIARDLDGVRGANLQHVNTRGLHDANSAPSARKRVVSVSGTGGPAFEI